MVGSTLPKEALRCITLLVCSDNVLCCFHGENW